MYNISSWVYVLWLLRIWALFNYGKLGLLVLCQVLGESQNCGLAGLSGMDHYTDHYRASATPATPAFRPQNWVAKLTDADPPDPPAIPRPGLGLSVKRERESLSEAAKGENSFIFQRSIAIACQRR